MERTEITAAVVEEIERLSAQRVAPTTIAARLKVSEYVVGVVESDTLGKGRPQPRDLFRRRARNRPRGVEATTIRMIQRMLQVGMLPRREIAREAGVSLNVVERVASGKRLLVNSGRPVVFKDLGERCLKKSILCKQCGGTIFIVPCRACRALSS